MNSIESLLRARPQNVYPYAVTILSLGVVNYVTNTLQVPGIAGPYTELRCLAFCATFHPHTV